MVVNRTDFTFANTSGRPIPYGEATDCYTKHPSPTDPSAYRCGLKGYFLIDLTDTGLIIDPMVCLSIVDPMVCLSMVDPMVCLSIADPVVLSVNS